jgi:hypothetical protein
VILISPHDFFFNKSVGQTSLNFIHTVTGMCDSRGDFGLHIGFNDRLRIVTTSNYKSLMELHTPNISVTAAHMNSSQSSLDVYW